MNPFFSPKLLSLSSLFLSVPASAALYYNDVYTDGSGNFGGSAGWSGDGSVQLNVGFAVPTVSTFDVDLITGFSAGALTLGETRAFVGGNGLNTGIIGTMDIAVGGGTADLRIDALWGSLGFGPNNFGITNFQDGADSLIVDYSFTEPIAAVQGGGGTPSGAAPFLAAMMGFGAGSTNFDIEAEYSGLVSSADGTNWVVGGGGGDAIDMTSSTLGWVSGDFQASASGVTLPNNQWQGVNGFDHTGAAYTPGGSGATQNDGIFQDDELTYATGIQFRISRSDGLAFGNSTEFVFSTNGNQYGDTIAAAIAVPEPSRAALMGLTLCAGLLGRRRRL